MGAFKRKTEIIESVETEILNNTNVSEETKTIIKNLVNEYEKTTYKEYADRHDFYAGIVDDMVNDCGFRDDELAQKMANNHPTLQQNFMRLCMKFIKKMAEKTYFDGRNESSVKLAKKIMEIEEQSLPFV